MEYKLSSFVFSDEITREEKHQVIKRINSIRSKCPSDSRFTGQFKKEGLLYEGEVKVLFSKGSFSVVEKGSNISELMFTILGVLEDQISAWKTVRFNQPDSFIDYNDWVNGKTAASSGG